MKRLWRDLRRHAKVLSVLLLAMPVISGACSGRGPIRVAGVVTGKHQIAPRGKPSESREKVKHRYFLWVKTEDGLVYVEVTREVFQGVVEGEQVCINCGSKGP